MSSQQKILVIRTDRIGDVVLTLPVAAVIKKHLPESYLGFLTRNYTFPLTEKHKYIDRPLILEGKKGKAGFFRLIRMLRREKFDTALVVSPSFKIALVTLLSGIKGRIGTGYRWYSFLFNKKVYEHRKDAHKHELEYNISMLSKLDIDEEIKPGNANFSIPVDENIKTRIKKLLLKNGLTLTKPLIIIHPGSGGSAVDLPIESYIRLTRMIADFGPAEIVITGSKEESEICQKLTLNKNIINLAGALNLNELIALISISEIFISNSTGPIHIAAALDKEVVGFYPKIVSCSAKRWGPYSLKSKVFSPSIDCMNCNKEQCKRLNCMNSIDVGEVFANVEKICKFIINKGANNA